MEKHAVDSKIGGTYSPEFLVASDNITPSKNLGKNWKILTHITRKSVAGDGCMQRLDASRISISPLLCSIYLPISLL